MTSKEALQEFYNRVTNEAIDNAKYLGEAAKSIQKWQEKYYIIEKCLKALEIIKNKCASNTNLWLVVCTRNYEDYESFVENKDHRLVRIEHNILTQQEYELLKEVLGSE